MDHKFFLRFATRIASSNSAGPEEYRSAISRSYYAADHEVLEFLRIHAKLEPVGKGDSHASVKYGLMWADNTDADQIINSVQSIVSTPTRLAAVVKAITDWSKTQAAIGKLRAV
jgi:hypothetical protein